MDEEIKKKPRYWLRFAFLSIKSLFNRPSMLKAPGAHFIAGFPGSGKTLLMNSIINEYDASKYFFLCNMGEFSGQENVYSFKIEEVFNEQKQVRSFPTVDHLGRKLAGVIFDEINLNFNRRANKQRDYNSLFIGLIEFLVSHRHQGVPTIWFIGQKLALQDGQLQLLFKYYHDILYTSRLPSYWIYKTAKQDDLIVWLPRKIKYNNYTKNFQDEFVLANKRIKKRKFRKKDFLTYNTRYLGEEYKTLSTLHWTFNQAYIDKKINNS